MIKAIIFDAGGVLHSSETEHIHRDIKETLQINEDQFKKAHSKFITLLQLGKISEDEYWQRFLKESGSRQSLPDQSLFAREYIKRFKKHKKVLNLVKLLKEKNYKLAVLSDTITPHKEYNDLRGIYDNFEIQIFSNEVGVKKPNEEIYLKTLRKLNVKPNEAVFIDDVSDYVEAANELGMNGILFTTSNILIKDLKRLEILS